MSYSGFDTWFADYLGQTPQQVELLLTDKTAVRFLIAWSLMETSCFHGYARGKELEKHCRRIVNCEGFDPSPLTPILEYFHARYQNKKLFANLMHGNTNPDIKPLRSRDIVSLSNIERVFFLVSVVYRYRNNIFHGSKGVQSWLQFTPQIEQCTLVMQALITHAYHLLSPAQQSMDRRRQTGGRC
jgi:hypothetical protein